LNIRRSTHAYSWFALTLSLALASTSTETMAANPLPTLSKVCGQATATLTCTAFSSEYSSCLSTKLRIKTEDGKSVASPKPRGLEKYTAIGLQCAKSKDGRAYFEVHYGERPFGCKVCEWYAIYDSHGALLTNNDPPVLHDRDLPMPDQSRPNSDEFFRVVDKLGLQNVEVDLID
jgi:hypothetical protein